MDFNRYKILTFDCYGTLIDWEKPISTRFRAALDRVCPTVSDDLILIAFANYQARHQATIPFLDYPDVLRRAYRDVLNGFGLNASPRDADTFADSVGEWPPFTDTLAALSYLGRHFRLGILSNVDNASMQRTLQKLEAPMELVVTAEDVSSYKPAFPHFERAIRHLYERGFSRHEILHVAQSKRHDHEPAARLGLASMWVNRQHARDGVGLVLPAQVAPTHSVNSLAELVDLHRASFSAP